MKAWIRRSLIAGAALVAVGGAGFAWLIHTTAGARFALHRAIAVTQGRLEIADVGGTLGSHLVLGGVSWKDEGVEARIARVDLDFAIAELLRRRVHIVALNLSDARLVLNTVTEKPAPPRQAPISLAAPLTIRLDALHVDKGGIVKNGESLLEFDTIDLGAAWTAQGIGLTDFKLRAPAGEVDVNAQIGADAGYSGGSDARFRWQLGGRTVAGTLHTHSDGQRVQVNLALSDPVPAKLDLDTAARAPHDWRLTLDVPPFAPQRVLPDSTLARLGLSLKASGSANGGDARGDVHGSVLLNDHSVLIDPLRFAYTDRHLHLDTLTLHSPEAAGEFVATGDIDLGAATPQAHVRLHWNGVEIPQDLAGQRLLSQGNLTLDGGAERFSATGTAALGPPGRLADLRLDLTGTPKAITLTQLAIVQPQGNLGVSGDVALDPQIGWSLRAKAERFDPGALMPSWPGSVNLDLTSQGTLTEQGPDATVQIQRLDGQLRQRPLTGTANLHLAPGYVVDGTLALASGESTLAVTGRGGTQTDADVGFTVASLGDLLPQAQGRLTGHVAFKGAWPALAAHGQIDGTRVAYAGASAATLAVTAEVKDLSAPSGAFDAHAEDVVAGSLTFASVDLGGDGNAAAHRLQLQAKGDPLGVQLDLRGANGKDGWSGTLDDLTLAIRDADTWKLEKPAALAARGGGASLGELCLAANGPRLCVSGERRADASAQLRYQLEGLPLALLARLGAPDAPLVLAGAIDGSGAVTRSAAGALDGNAALHSASGSAAYADHPDQPLLAYTDFRLDAKFAPQAQEMRVHATLSHDGQLDGSVQLGGAQQALSGQVRLDLNDLGFVELFSSDVAAVKGRLQGQLDLSGSAAQPAFGGTLQLLDFAAEVPAAGLKLHDGHVSVTARDAQHLDIDGTLASGEGRLQLKGSAGTSAQAPLAFTLEGKDFLAADIPAAHVLVSPQLDIRRDAEGLKVGGEVGIPKANVDLSKLPGGGAAKTSPDVVVVDAAATQTKTPLPIFAEVTVKLGDAVKLKGFGLDGALEGQLAVSDRPGKQTTGRGEIRASGTYKAYGQDLTIQTGRLQFAGTAIDNPGLDLRAVRKIDDEISAGLRVQGTAQVPVLTVFSEPPMEQAEALSYLITGKPLSALKSGEGDMVGTAARALGSATGDLLAKSVGARLGVDAGVSDNAALGGAAFTVGKYLSPKLYLSYGVGLFVPGEVITLRYLLSKRWNLEAQSATNDNRAGINYRYEK